MAPPSNTGPVTLLRSTEKDLPDSLRSEILQLGDAAIPPLLELLQDEEANLEDSPGGGWGPIHAVSLLVDLKAVAAIEPMLEILETTEFDAIVHDRILVHLPRIGRAVLEPTLRRLSTLAQEDELYSDLCHVAARLGVPDPRIFDHLCALLEVNETIGAINLADYGDKRALPLLRKHIEEFEPNWDSDLGLMDLTEMVEAYRELGGSVPKELDDHVQGLTSKWKDARAAAKASTQLRTAPKVGRNDPCPCGSGKKYKKCCQP